MNRTNLGEFEELVLLTVGVLYNNAYSVAITNELENQSGRKVNISAVHPVLYRLEEKGFLISRLGDATAKRGGKRKRLFSISSLGKIAMDGSMNLRMKLRQNIPSIALENL